MDALRNKAVTPMPEVLHAQQHHRLRAKRAAQMPADALCVGGIGAAGLQIALVGFDRVFDRHRFAVGRVVGAARELPRLVDRLPVAEDVAPIGGLKIIGGGEAVGPFDAAPHDPHGPFAVAVIAAIAEEDTGRHRDVIRLLARG